MVIEYPYITLFQTINSHYLYDINRKELVRISQPLFDYLETVIKQNKNLDVCADMPEEAKELRERGLLSGNRVKQIRHPKSQIVQTTLERRIQKVTLQLTQNCNFRCKYCHYTSNDGGQRTHSEKRMSFDLAKRSVDFLKEHSIDTAEVFIGFYGGEPLLEFEMIKEIVKYAERIFEGKKLFFTISSNATLMTKEMIDFMELHNFDLLISLDGPEELHNKNRIFPNGEGTFVHVIDKLQYIHDKYPKLYKKMLINVVIDPSVNYWKYEDVFSSYPFLKGANFTSTVIDDYEAKEKNKYSEEFVTKSGYEDFLVNLVLLNRIDPEFLSPLIKQRGVGIRRLLDELETERSSMPEEWAPGGPCMPGELRTMVTVEGNFIACERVNEISDCMIIGNIEDGFNLKKVNALLNVAQLTKDKCVNCVAFDSCSLCGKYADDNGSLSKSVRESNCDDVVSRFNYSLKKLALIQEAMDLYHERCYI